MRCASLVIVTVIVGVLGFWGSGSGGGRGGNSGRYDSSSRDDMARLFINIGKNQNVKPGDILGAIAGESGMPGKMVGSIDMYDKYTFCRGSQEKTQMPC